MTDNEESSTVVSDPSIPSAVESTVCRRPEVCVCDTCEAKRWRLIHRRNSTSDSSTSSKKRVRENEHGTEQSSDNSSPTAVLEPNLPLAKKSVLKTATSATSTSTASLSMDSETRLETMTEACKTILRCIGEDECREGLVKTPERWAKALLFMCNGYDKLPTDVTNGAVFQENHDEMVVVRDIDIHSLCEHHMLPFTGRVHIGYIPNGKIIGLSKLARIAELFARRLQVQERLTRQIADAIVETVEPLGVAVVVECTHFCMVMRGVQKTGAVTTTSSVRGCFESNPKTRAEFFSIIHGNSFRMC